MKMRDVQPNAETPTDTITDCEKVDLVFSSRAAGNCLFCVPWLAYSLLFCRLTGATTVKSFSSVNHMELTRLSGYLLSNCFARVRRVSLLASVSFCACFLLKHFSLRSLCIILKTDLWEMPASLAICLVDLWVPGASSWLSTSSSTALTFGAVEYFFSCQDFSFYQLIPLYQFALSVY